MADQPAQSSAEQTADILAMAAAEAAAPGADTENAYECPFCVMMRKGGCEDPFKVRWSYLGRRASTAQDVRTRVTSLCSGMH